MKILLVANGYPPTAVGGVETYTAELALSLSGFGDQISVFCRESNFSKPDYGLSTENQGQISITRVVNDHKRATSFRQTFIDPQIEEIFTRYILAEKPDLIHFNHLIGLSARLPLIAAEQNIPAVITLHDFWPICHQVKLIDWQGRICPGPAYAVDCPTCASGGSAQQDGALIEKATRLVKRILPARVRRTIRSAMPEGEALPPAMISSPEIFRERLDLFTRAVLAAQRILVPSEYSRTELGKNGLPRERIQVIPLGIAVQASRSPRESLSGSLTFATIGPIQPIKGTDIAIKAFSKVPGEQLRLNIYGRHDLFPRDHIKQVLKLAQADPRVSILGPFDPRDRVSIFNAIDVLIVPSPAPETFSLAAHEALAMGKPVLASRIGALPEIIQDGVNGFLFEPGNDTRLAEFITLLASQPGILEKLSMPGTTPILTSIEHAREIKNIYHQVVRSGG
ncbi:MAG TPA: glycosyltransferase family 4 protein [Anaerolineales bacterium]|nr:glycosyltransferase family 4 protein [Anaerolineales bacterium]